jgi:hypothetical protein
MTRKIRTVRIPEESALAPMLGGAYFYDAFAAPLANASLTPTEIFLRAIAAAPRWVTSLMMLRNALARRFGLKAVGAAPGTAQKPAEAYRIGDRIAIFTVVGQLQNELVLGIDDWHLDVRVSVLKPRGGEEHSYVLSTVVRCHNAFGRAYMVPVARIHPFVVRALMRRATL